MPIFTIDADNNITSWDSRPAGTTDLEVFTSLDELATVATNWPSTRLVEIWNSLTGVVPVKKFKDRTTALGRIWKQIQHLAPTPAPQAKAPEAQRPAEDATTDREGSKKAHVLDLLRRPDGATLEEIMTATGWQAHTVRGFLSGALTKKMGLTVESWRNVDKVRVYRVAA